MTCSTEKALALADRAQAICDAQHGSGDRCCLMNEVAVALRALADRSSGDVGDQHMPERMRLYLAEYATLQERIAAKLETPGDAWAGLMNAEVAEDIRNFLAALPPDPLERAPC